MEAPTMDIPPMNIPPMNIPPMKTLPVDTSQAPITNNNYALSGKIMLTAIIVLFSVMILMVLLHLYARWYLQRARNRHNTNRRRNSSFRRTHLIFYAGPDAPSTPRGLDPFVLASLPVFNYAPNSSDSGTELKEFSVGPTSAPLMLECAVCLSEFAEGEKVRLLPKCQHCFHLHCIDMWFYSHATCPLCRSSVEKFDPNATCHLSLGGRRKDSGVGRVRIEVPRRTEFETELTASSPASYRSPAGRLLSLKRILSMGRRSAAVSPSGGAGPSCDSAELDLECGASESTQQRSRAQTPR